MKRFTVVLALALALPSAFALDVGAEIKSGNLYFSWSQDAQTAPDVKNYAPATLFWGGALWAEETIGESFGLRISFDMDPVLRNIVSALVNYDAGFAKLSVGPFVGAFNSQNAPLKSGISTTIRLEWPGVAFFGIRADSSIGAGIVAVGDYTQELSELSAGLYIPNAIVSAVMTSKRFYLQSSATTTTADASLIYALTLEMYKKNVPYTLLATIGYESLAKSFDTAGVVASDRLGSILIGARISAQVTPEFKLLGELRSAVYTFGLENLLARGPVPNAFMFTASIGAVITIGGQERIPEAPAISPEEASQPEGSALPAVEESATPTEEAASEGSTPTGESTPATGETAPAEGQATP